MAAKCRGRGSAGSRQHRLLRRRVRYPTQEALAKAVKRVRDSEYPVSHGCDHGASEFVWLTDRDGNGLELCWDRPVGEWPRTPDGALALVNFPLDLDALLDH